MSKAYELSRRIHPPRAIGLGLGALAVAAALWQLGGTPAWHWVLLAFNGLIWPHVALALALRSADPIRAEHRNLLVDSVLGTFWLPAMGFNVLPSVLVASMLMMDNISVGGRRLFAAGLVAQAAGLGAGWLLAGTPVQLAADLTTIVACMPFLVVFPVTIGITTRRLAQQVTRQRQAVERSERLHRTTLDAMDAGIVLFDDQDRLALCNEDFRQLYRPIADRLQPGMHFTDLLRHAIAAGLVPEAEGREEAWIAERLVEHEKPRGPVLRRLADGRWRRIVEQRLPDGGLLAFSTDVTELIRRERELEQLIEQRDAFARALGTANERLESLSETDALTSIANRRQFDRRLHEEWHRAGRQGSALGLLMIDVDHFKRYNDRHGHLAGDACLQRIAAVLRACAQRAGEVAARYGGEEFAILLPQATAGEALAVAERCRAAVAAEAIPHGDSPIGPAVTLSIGVAVLQPEPIHGTPDALVIAADRALYLAKTQGRDRVVADPAA